MLRPEHVLETRVGVRVQARRWPMRRQRNVRRGQFRVPDGPAHGDWKEMRRYQRGCGRVFGEALLEPRPHVHDHNRTILQSKAVRWQDGGSGCGESARWKANVGV